MTGKPPPTGGWPPDDGHSEITPDDREHWRAWLTEHHESDTGLWLIYFKKGAERTGLTYDEAVEEALCFGWIDSKVQSIDAERFRQWFSPRRPGSIWSALNKQRIEKLVAESRMTPAGMARIEAAQADGSWSQYDDVEAGVVPDDLQAALDSSPGAAEGFTTLAPSARKQVLFWVASAKRDETRRRRIAASAAAAVRGELPTG